MGKELVSCLTPGTFRAMPVIAWGGMEFTDCKGCQGGSWVLSVVCTTSSRSSDTWLTGSPLCTDYLSIKSRGKPRIQFFLAALTLNLLLEITVMHYLAL